MNGPDPRLEFFVEPFTEGRPGPHVTAAIEEVASRGLEIQVGPFGSVARGELEALIDAASPLLRSALSAGADRISLHITTGSHPDAGIGPTSLHDALSRMIVDVERELGASWQPLEGGQASGRAVSTTRRLLLRKARGHSDARGVSSITIYNYSRTK